MRATKQRSNSRRFDPRLLPRLCAASIVVGATTIAAGAAPGAAAADVRNDFNGDGRADLVIGVMAEDLGGLGDPGAFHVLPGTSTGVRARGSQFFHQDTEGFPDSNEITDGLGGSWASGDFDNDGYDDLAVGAAGESVGAAAAAGQVTVLMGSPFGLSTTEAEVFNQETSGIGGSAEDNDRFGARLVSGDFDNDGNDDLAIGVPGEAIGVEADSGVIHVLTGTANGLTSVGAGVIKQEALGETSEANDLFGGSFAVGDFDGDGADDLAVGAPGEDGTAVDSGSVAVLPGSNSGLVEADTLVLTQDVVGVPGAGEADDQFGSDLATGDFDNDGDDDLAISTPGEGVGAVSDAGALHLFNGGPDGVAAAGSRQIYQGNGAPGSAESQDRFGESIESNDFDDDGRDDLAVSVPGESFAGFHGAGQVVVLKGTAIGINSAGAKTWTQDSPGIADVPEDDDAFGVSIASGDYNGDGRADIAVTSLESIGAQANAGSVHVLFGAEAGIVADRSQFFSQDSGSIADSAEAADLFGVSS
jgi:hypothetical protein